MTWKSARWALTATMVVCAVLIACRMLVGPLIFPIPVRSPMNVESIFGLAAIFLLLIRAAPDPAPTGLRLPLLNWQDAAAVLATILLVGLAFWKTTQYYFLSDDFVLVKHARQWHGLHNAFTSKGADGFYRPLTFAYFAWVATWAGLDPYWWHAIEVVLHAANSSAVFILARALRLPRIAAGFAAALFAVHATRPEVVAWVASRTDSLATLFVLLGLIFFIWGWEASGRAVFCWLGVSLAAMALALITKESSFTFPLLLVLWLAANGGLKLRRGWYALLPFFVVTVSLFALRWVVLGGIGGYRDAGGAPQALSVGLIPVLKVFALRLWAILFFPINWTVEPGAVLGIVTILYLAAMLRLAGVATPRRDLLLAIGWLFAMALPPVQQLLLGADLQKARYLYLPSVGFCLLLAAALTRLKEKPRWVVAVVILAFHLVALDHNLSAWSYASDKARSACAVAAACEGRIAAVGIPGSLRGVYFFANGFPECVAMQRNFAPVEVDLLAGAPEPAKYSCVLRWDSEANELRRSNGQ